MADIGFSTSCLYRCDMPLIEVLDAYLSVGATAVEISFRHLETLERFSLTPDLISRINQFNFVSIHAPFEKVKYAADEQTRFILRKFTSFLKNFYFTGLVVHPDTVEDFSTLFQFDLPIMIENMDKRKDNGVSPAEFKKYKEIFPYEFVLDVQHAYDLDPTMQLAEELIEVMGSKLKYMHISGQTSSSSHAPLYLSENKRAIVKVLEKRIDVPKILEGRLEKFDSQVLENGLKFIKSFET